MYLWVLTYKTRIGYEYAKDEVAEFTLRSHNIPKPWTRCIHHFTNKRIQGAENIWSREQFNAKHVKKV